MIPIQTVYMELINKNGTYLHVQVRPILMFIQKNRLSIISRVLICSLFGISHLEGINLSLRYRA